jgi:hypothetical protein
MCNLHHQRAAQRGRGRGHALGRGSQDTTVDPKGSLKTVPQVDDASRFLAASVRMRKQLSKTTLMLSADRCVVRENRRNFLRRRSVFSCSRSI